MKHLRLLTITGIVFFLIYTLVLAQESYQVVSGGARLRSEPNTTSSVIAKIAGNTAVTVVQIVQGSSVAGNTKWYKVSFNGQVGYVHSSLLITSSLTNTDATSEKLDYPGKILFNSYGREYSLYLADADGKNIRVLTDKAYNDINNVDNSPSWSPDDRQLAYSSVKDGNAEIYVIDLESKEQHRLTNDIGIDSSPSWSPDGQQILFASSRKFQQSLSQYVMNADGTNQQEIPFRDSIIWYGTWSSDGQFMLVQGFIKQYVIFKANLDGSQSKELLNYKIIGTKSPISPDGLQIAYSATNQDGVAATLYISDIDGRNIKEIASKPCHSPTWSPDSKQIICESLMDSANFRLFTTNVDGSAFQLFTNTGNESDENPVWSHDGKTVAFLSGRSAFHTYKLESSDAEPQQLPDVGYGYIWSFDQKYLAYIAFADGNIYVQSTDQTTAQRLTTGGEIVDFAWSPATDEIAYTKTNGTNTDFYLVNADGTNSVKFGSLKRQGVGRMQWSPDGTKVAVAGLVTNRTLYIITVADGHQQRTPLLVTVSGSFEWSPDSKFILGTSPIDNKTDNSQLFVFNVLTKDTKFFVPDKRYFAASNPHWSPDGKQIIYAYGVTTTDIYSLRSDGTHARQLTNSNSVNKDPLWSPDGKYIAFLSNRDGKNEIYMMLADGTNVVRLTHTLGSVGLMGWTP